MAALAASTDLAARIMFMECRLAGSRRVDLSFDISADAYRRAWPDRIWNGPDASHVGIEYDLDEFGGEPAVFHPIGCSVAAAPDLAPALRHLADPAAVAAAMAYLETQPRSARIDYVAAMPSRPGQPLRVNLSSTALRQRPDEEAPDVVMALARRADHTAIALDFNEDGLLPRWGIELFLRPQAGIAAWSALFDDIVSADLAEPSRVAAAMAWPGRRACAAAPPIGAFLGLSLADWRDFSHVKLVVDGKMLSAKLYLACARRWLPAVAGV
ncbi:MAG TPA: hypothetical protein VIL69_06550 [Roseomonas sp.]